MVSTGMSVFVAKVHGRWGHSLMWNETILHCFPFFYVSFIPHDITASALCLNFSHKIANLTCLHSTDSQLRHFHTSINTICQFTECCRSSRSSSLNLAACSKFGTHELMLHSLYFILLTGESHKTKASSSGHSQPWSSACQNPLHVYYTVYYTILHSTLYYTILYCTILCICYGGASTCRSSLWHLHHATFWCLEF